MSATRGVKTMPNLTPEQIATLTLTPVAWERIFRKTGNGYGGCGTAETALARLSGQTVTALDCITAPELDDRNAINYTLWLLARTDRKMLIWLACDMAERALPKFERRFPDDKRPRAAIELARKRASGGRVTKTQLRTYAAHAAAYAAYAAAYADAADAAAADAAYAADAAAYAAAYAAERHWQREHITAVLTAIKARNHA